MPGFRYGSQSICRWISSGDAATNYLFNSTDRDKLAEALDPEWPGPLPYTLLIAPDGKVIYRQRGPLEPLEVKRAIVGNSLYNSMARTYQVVFKELYVFDVQRGGNRIFIAIPSARRIQRDDRARRGS